jgi:hypothetical protein
MKYLFKLDTTKPRRGNGPLEFPLCLYFYEGNGTPAAFYSVKKLLENRNLPSSFTENVYDEIINGKTARLEQVRKGIKQVEFRIREEIENRQIKTKDQVKKLLKELTRREKEGDLKPKTLEMVFEEKIKELDDKGTSSAEYKTCLSHLKKFLTSTNNLSVYHTDSVTDFDPQLIVDFKKHLSNLVPSLSINSIHSYLRQFRAIAKKAKISLPDEIFSGISISTVSNKDNFISPGMLRDLWDIEVSDNMEEWARNLAILTYLLGGMNLVDILALKKAEVQQNPTIQVLKNGNIFIRYIRTKTKRTSKFTKETYCYVFASNQRVQKLLQYFKFDHSAGNRGYYFDLTPPCHQNQNIEDRLPEHYTDLWNPYARKHLSALFKNHREVLDPEGLFKYVGLKLIRVTAFNAVLVHHSMSEQGLVKATASIGDTPKMGKYYITTPSIMASVRKNAEGLLSAMGLSPEHAENNQ